MSEAKTEVKQEIRKSRVLRKSQIQEGYFFITFDISQDSAQPKFRLQQKRKGKNESGKQRPKMHQSKQKLKSWTSPIKSDPETYQQMKHLVHQQSHKLLLKQQLQSKKLLLKQQLKRHKLLLKQQLIHGPRQAHRLRLLSTSRRKSRTTMQAGTTSRL